MDAVDLGKWNYCSVILNICAVLECSLCVALEKWKQKVGKS